MTSDGNVRRGLKLEADSTGDLLVYRVCVW